MKYRTIVADPPWVYEDGFPQGPTRGTSRSTVPLPYASMSTDELAALDVDGLADGSAWLFVWTTNRYLPDVFGIVEAWGFDYTQTVTWRKTGDPSPFVRSVAPQHSEYLVAAKRGAPGRRAAFPSSVVDAPAQDRHSRKPEAFMDWIEQIGEPPRLEMFSRRARFGWDTWGNEALEHVELAAGPAARLHDVTTIQRSDGERNREHLSSAKAAALAFPEVCDLTTGPRPTKVSRQR